MEPTYNHITGPNYPLNHENKVRVIASFNGGGVRGAIAARICQEIEEITKRSMVELVDCFAGTSVGGMLAIGLNVPKEKGSLLLKYTARENVEFLKKNAATIFPQSMNPLPKIAALFTSKYSTTNLDKALKEHFGDMVISDSIKDVVIPSSEISRGGSPWWFSKQKIINLENENAPPISEEAAKNVHVTDVLKASGSAPYYFPYYSIPFDGQEYHFVDGGCYANNPSAIGISYAHLLYGSQKPLLVGYFGTGAPPRPLSVPNLYFQGGLYWIWNYIATSMNLNADEASLISKIQIQSELLRKPNEDYFEFQPRISVLEYELDDSSEANMNRLISATELYIKDNQFKIRNFCNQLLIAKGFDPIPVHTEEDIRHQQGIIDDFEVIEKEPNLCQIFF
ncbi:MAG: patatin-like phospholipase family protein [Parachlamydiaceae bacterium]|nr:patatin-like phospholipase family protein [Parachlamydiaceae bacterium]